jgi:hypothetical protein
VPVALLVGRESPAFFGEMVRWLAPRLQVPVVTVPGGHGAYFDHAPRTGRGPAPPLQAMERPLISLHPHAKPDCAWPRCGC